MEVFYDASFEKSIIKIKDKSLSVKLLLLIKKLEEANHFREVTQIKKMRGFESFYRIRIGDYRVGLELIDDSTIRLILVSHRKDIYKKFP